MSGGEDLVAEQVMGAVVRASRSRPALERIGLIVVNALKRQVSHPGTGAVYTRGGVEHQASSPGESPAVDTGRLRNSMDFAVGADALGGYVDVGTNVEYAPFLEYGTSRMAARPFMRPAVAEARPLIEGLMGEAIVAEQVRAIGSLPPVIELPPQP